MVGNIIRNVNAKSASRLTPEELLKKSKHELVEMILGQKDLQIPISVFLNKAGPLECLVKYLKEEKKLSIKEISRRLNRNIQTIWTTYRNSKIRTISYKESLPKVPLYIFSKIDKSILESLVFYLHISSHLRFCEISKLLNRDTRAIWMHYHRYKLKEKNGGMKNGK